MTKLKKPKPRIIEELDYNEVIDYIEKKYNIKTRDYANHSKDKSAPYLDFWHWVIDRDPEIGNGSYTSLCLPSDREANGYDEPEPWITEILTLIEKEFGEHADHGFLELWVEW